MNVNPGDLKKKIQIYTKGTTKDADGYPVTGDVLFHSCYAKASRTSGTELIKANADMSETNMRFLIRYTTKAITRKMIVKYSGNNYEISYVNDYEDSHEYIEIIADRLAV